MLFVALLAGALVYPWLTAGKTFRNDQRIGLDGKTPPEHTPEGAAAIAWLRANAPGDAVILEAAGDDYDGRGIGASAVSASTGLATVLGWAGHEQQWRGGDPPSYAQIDPRKADIATIYNAGDLDQAASCCGSTGRLYLRRHRRAGQPTISSTRTSWPSWASRCSSRAMSRSTE